MSKNAEEWLDKLNSRNEETRWEAICYFADHGDRRAVDRLIALALDPREYEDTQYYAAQGVLTALGQSTFVATMAQKYDLGNEETRELAYCALVELGGRPALPHFIRGLEDNDPEIQSAALTALGSLEDPTLLHYLQPFLKSPEESVRRSAHEALARISPEDAVDTAIEALTARRWETRRNGAMILEKHPHPRAVEPLLERLLDSGENSNVRFKAAEALGATRDTRAFFPLLEALEDRDKNVRSTAARQLGKFEDPRAITPLARYLHQRQDGEYAHSEAAIGLAMIGHFDAVPHLLRALDDDRESVRQWAADALGEIRPAGEEQRREVIESLLFRLSDDSLTVQEHVIQSLGRLQAGEARNILRQFLESSIMELRHQSVYALGDLGDPTVATDLVKLRRDPHNFVRQAVAEALGQLGHPDTFAAVVELLDDTHPQVRTRAARSLGDFGDARAIDPLLQAGEKTQSHEEFERICFWGAAARLGDSHSADRLWEMVEEDRELAYRAAIELARAGDERGRARCEEETKSRYFDVQLESIEALGMLANPSSRPALHRALQDHDQSVRQAARKALEKLNPEWEKDAG